MKTYWPMPLRSLCATVVLSAVGDAGNGDPGGSAGGLPDGRVEIRGIITSVSQADATAQGKGTLGAVMVEGPKAADTKYDRASIRVTTQTSIFVQHEQSCERTTFAAIKIGQRVQARFSGPVAESYPVQATAGEIVILQ